MNTKSIHFQKNMGWECEHRVKSVQIRSFCWSVFSCIWTEYGEILRISRIQSKFGKIQTRKNSVFEHFSRSGVEKCRTEQSRSNRIGPNKLNAWWKSNFRIVIKNELIRKLELLIRHQKNEWFWTYIVFEKSDRQKLTL